MAEKISLCTPHFLKTHLPVVEHLSWFCHLAAVNRAAVNIGMQVSLRQAGLESLTSS